MSRGLCEGGWRREWSGAVWQGRILGRVREDGKLCVYGDVSWEDGASRSSAVC